ncbi:MAG: hypothetical protein QOG82_1270 [Actinomycetota bacterium]|nr:hypothetical protein [Actinomycetota bacterium]
MGPRRSPRRLDVGPTTLSGWRWGPDENCPVRRAWARSAGRRGLARVGRGLGGSARPRAGRARPRTGRRVERCLGRARLGRVGSGRVGSGESGAASGRSAGRALSRAGAAWPGRVGSGRVGSGESQARPRAGAALGRPRLQGRALARACEASDLGGRRLGRALPGGRCRAGSGGRRSGVWRRGVWRQGDRWAPWAVGGVPVRLGEWRRVPAAGDGCPGRPSSRGAWPLWSWPPSLPSGRLEGTMRACEQPARTPPRPPRPGPGQGRRRRPAYPRRRCPRQPDRRRSARRREPR